MALEKIIVDQPQADIIYYPHFFKLLEANDYYHLLKKNIPQQQEDIVIYGKT